MSQAQADYYRQQGEEQNRLAEQRRQQQQPPVAPENPPAANPGAGGDKNAFDRIMDKGKGFLDKWQGKGFMGAGAGAAAALLVFKSKSPMMILAMTGAGFAVDRFLIGGKDKNSPSVTEVQPEGTQNGFITQQQNQGGNNGSGSPGGENTNDTNSNDTPQLTPEELEIECTQNIFFEEALYGELDLSSFEPDAGDSSNQYEQE